jgi:hypothetical protein
MSGALLARARSAARGFQMTVSVAVLAVLMTGCSDATGPLRPAASTAPVRPVAAPAPVAIPTLATSAGLRYPLSPYQLSDEQQGTLTYLAIDLQKRCVTRRGFSFDPTLTAAGLGISIRAELEAESRLWGISDASTARKFGYHLPTWLIGSVKPQSIGSMPVREQAAVLACHSQIDRVLSGAIGPNAGNTVPLVAQIQGESYAEAANSAEVRTAIARWSACMRRHGYRYKTPFAPAGVFNRQRSVSKQEIQVAEADLRCKAKTNLLGIAYAVQSGFEIALMAENKAALAGIRKEVSQEAAALARVAKTYGIAAGRA